MNLLQLLIFALTVLAVQGIAARLLSASFSLCAVSQKSSLICGAIAWASKVLAEKSVAALDEGAPSQISFVFLVNPNLTGGAVEG